MLDAPSALRRVTETRGSRLEGFTGVVLDPPGENGGEIHGEACKKVTQVAPREMKLSCKLWSNGLTGIDSGKIFTWMGSTTWGGHL